MPRNPNAPPFRVRRRQDSHESEPMTTKLDRPLKREIEVDGVAYTATISPDGIRVVEKGKRKGQELTWRSIVAGDASLAEDLRISLDATSRDD